MEEEEHHQELQVELEGQESYLQEVAEGELHALEEGVVLACRLVGVVLHVGEEAEVALHAMGEVVEEGLLILEEVRSQT